jgi:hypothetical protein
MVVARVKVATRFEAPSVFICTLNHPEYEAAVISAHLSVQAKAPMLITYPLETLNLPLSVLLASLEIVIVVFANERVSYL